MRITARLISYELQGTPHNTALLLLLYRPTSGETYPSISREMDLSTQTKTLHDFMITFFIATTHIVQ